MTTSIYRGKYPHQIKDVSVLATVGLTVLTTNDGRRLELSTRDVVEFTGGKAPQLGEDIRPYLAIASSLD